MQMWEPRCSQVQASSRAAISAALPRFRHLPLLLLLALLVLESVPADAFLISLFSLFGKDYSKPGQTDTH